MKKMVLVFALILVAGTLFAAGPARAAAAGGGTQNHSGVFGGNSQGDQDQTQDRLQLKDESCLDDGAVDTLLSADEKGDQDRLQLKDGTGDGEPDQDRVRLSRPV